MKLFKLLSGAIICSAIFLTGCQKDIRKETASALLQSKTSQTQAGSLSAEAKAKLKKLRTSLPAGYEKRLNINANRLLKTHPEYRNLVNRVMKVTETTCNDNTALFQWLDNEVSDWDSNIIFFAIISGMLDFPTYDAYLFENSSANQYFGVNGENTQRIKKTFKDLQRFWDIQSSNIAIVAMHGSMLRDREKVIRIDKILFGDSQEVAEYWADLIGELLKIVPQYRNGDHPIFTFNSFALEGFDFPPYGKVASKIIMGDGISQGFAAIGYGDVAPQAILAHEFGHHVQFQLHLFTNEGTPEATRRTELMADALSAYYLSHARGASMQWKRVKQFLQVFFAIGDCSFTSTGHHGTPTQRMASAEWGYSVANDAQKQGHILPSKVFTTLFDKKLPELVSQ